MERILITTISHLDGVKIDKYIGMISANQVAGTGFLSDFTASFSDFFGGTSGTYRSQMDNLLDNVQQIFLEKASAIGANAVIGVSVDFDNISAKSMSMFMVSMHGTAVKIQNPQNAENDSLVSEIGAISKEILAVELSKKIIAKNLETGVKPSSEEWKFLCSHKVKEVADKLLVLYEKEVNKDYPSDKFIENFQLYLSCLDYNDAVELIYNTNANRYDTIIKCNLFSPEHVLKIIKESGIIGNIKLLEADKPTYDRKDLDIMKKIIDILNNRPNVGKIEYKRGIFSGGSDKFVCACGQVNDSLEKYCFSCGKDIKGFSKEENTVIDTFILKVKTLDEILNKNSSNYMS